MQTAVVSGANRGLGMGVVAALLEKNFHVVALTRKVEQAREALGAHPQLTVLKVDVAREEEVAALPEQLQRAGIKQVDVLINNAGVFMDDRDPTGSGVLASKRQTCRDTFEVNTLGALHLTQVLMPFMQKAPLPRIVNVSSGMGGLTEMQGGYPAYRFSKVALNALTRILAAELQNTRTKVNSVCPGWVRTDMGGPQATRDLSEGVQSILFAALLDEKGPTGGFFRDGKSIPW